MPGRRPGDPRFLSTLAILVLIALADCFIFYRSADQIGQMTAAWNAELQDLAVARVKLFSENVAGRLRWIDALSGVARLVSDAHRRGDVAAKQASLAELDRLATNNPSQFPQIGATDLRGDVLWSTAADSATSVNIADREHFRKIADGKASHFVSAPLMGRLTGKLTVQFASGDYAADGRLLGVIVVSVAAMEFQSIAGKEKLDKNDVLTIFSRTGEVLSRSQDTGIRQLATDDHHLHAFQSAPNGTIRGPSTLDGIDRVLAWQWLDDGSLVATAGISTRDRIVVLNDAIAGSRHSAVITAGLVTLLGFAGMVATQWWRRAAEAEAKASILRDNESLFRRLGEGLPDLIRLLDGKGDAIYVNPASREILGVEPEDLLGQGLARFIHPDDTGKAIAAKMLHGRPGDYASTLLRLVRPDRNIIWIESVVRVLDPAKSDGIALIASSRDVSRQVATETALREAKGELEALLRQTNGILYRSLTVADDSPLVTFVSDSVEQMTGYTVAEAMAPGWFQSNLDPSYLPAFVAYLARLRQTGSASLTFRCRRKDGQWIWVRLTSRRESGPNGVAQAVGFAHDVTREHTIDLQLAQVAKMASLGEMATGLAHELNQPLATISMAAENALAALPQPGDPTLTAKLDRIRRQAVRASEIVKRMRIFGRKQDGAPTHIAISDAIAGAADIASTRLMQARATLTTDIAPDLPAVVGHAVMLEQVLVNLIANAADAIETRTPPLAGDDRSVRISASHDTDRIRIRVSDRAGGVDPEILTRIFEPFFTTKPVGAGIGLGLSVSYGIVTEMGGTIAAWNADGGTVFELALLPALAEQGAGPVASGTVPAAHGPGGTPSQVAGLAEPQNPAEANTAADFIEPGR
jgi:PAS domain S-box-containing protein